MAFSPLPKAENTADESGIASPLLFPAVGPWSSAHGRDGAPLSSMRQQRAGNPGNPAGTRQLPGAEHPLLVIKASKSHSEYVRNVRDERPEMRQLLNCFLLVEARVRRHERIKQISVVFCWMCFKLHLLQREALKTPR